MALKDITLGQYFPGNSPVHRLDPRTKIVAVFLYIVALFLAKSFISYAIMNCNEKFVFTKSFVITSTCSVR